MSMYPANDNDQDSLYPTDDNYVRNPMRRDLNANGFNITNINALGLTGSGAITGVNTINGLPYPPFPTPLAASRNQQFQFPTVLNVFGDNAQNLLFTVYDSANGINTQLQPLFTNTKISLIMVVMPVNIQQNSAGDTDQGLFDFYLKVNGAQKAASGQFIIPPRQQYRLQTEASQIATLTFYLVRGVDFTNSSDVITLWGTGQYNYNYYLNYNLQHAVDSQPTICNAVGFP